MAIKQQITNVSGVKTEYHRISSAMIDYTLRKAYITVLSYIGSAKRDEEKAQTNDGVERDTLMRELDELVANPTEENEARRIELTNEVNALYERTPEDVAPRNVSEERYEIDLLADTDFSLEFAYNWLKENIYTSPEDC